MRNKHLTLADRQAIAAGLDTKFSFKEIARAIHKDCTTVSKEVKRNHMIVKSGCFGHGYNNCAYSFTCSKTSVCTDCRNRQYIKKCRYCSLCNDNCDCYKPAVCKELLKPPYVCNGCSKRAAKCTLLILSSTFSPFFNRFSAPE